MKQAVRELIEAIALGADVRWCTGPDDDSYIAIDGEAHPRRWPWAPSAIAQHLNGHLFKTELGKSYRSGATEHIVELTMAGLITAYREEIITTVWELTSNGDLVRDSSPFGRATAEIQAARTTALGAGLRHGYLTLKPIASPRGAFTVAPGPREV